MTREKEKYQAVNNAWNLQGLTNQEQKIPYKLGFLEGFDYADQHPRKGLWDSEKVCKTLKDYMLKERFFDNRIEKTAIIDNVVCDLRKAMEEHLQKAAEWQKQQDKQLKSAWSEEDEWKFSDILALLRGGENCHYNTPELFAWLKSIKDRVQPQQSKSGC